MSPVAVLPENIGASSNKVNFSRKMLYSNGKITLKITQPLLIRQLYLQVVFVTYFVSCRLCVPVQLKLSMCKLHVGALVIGYSAVTSMKANTLKISIRESIPKGVLVLFPKNPNVPFPLPLSSFCIQSVLLEPFHVLPWSQFRIRYPHFS